MLRWLALAALVAAGCVSAADAQQYDSFEDFNTLDDAGNDHPVGIWSDGTTMWVGDFDADKIYAYHMSNTARASKDFTLHPDNDGPEGIWSDGTTMWVADDIKDKIFAYDMTTKSRDSSKDFVVSTLQNAGNNDPAGIWSDGTTMWVADWFDGKLYAYDMTTKSRDSSKDFGLHRDNARPTGIWSDGYTMWVADDSKDKIFAYNWITKERDATKDFGTLAAGNDSPAGIWADVYTMWVADRATDKLYAYWVPPPPDLPYNPSPFRSNPPPPSPNNPLPPPNNPPPPSPSNPPLPGIFVNVPPSDTAPPTVKSVERTGNATTTNRALTWNVTFSEPVVVTGADIPTNYTSVANATIPDLGMAYDTILVDVPGVVTGGSISVDLHHPITSGLLIELVAPDCTRFVVHNQTTIFLYKLRQLHDLGDLVGVGTVGQWALHVHDRAEYWNGTLNGWTLALESEGAVESRGTELTITQHVAGPGNHTLSLDGYDIRDRAGNRLVDTDPAVNEPYHVVGVARTCHME